MMLDLPTVKGFVIHEIQSDANQAIAKQLTAKEAFSPTARYNPFQKEIETRLLVEQETTFTKRR